MSHDDFEVHVYKVLAYLMACLQEGVAPSMAKAKEASGCNDVYWRAVINSMAEDGLVTGIEPERSYFDVFDEGGVTAGRDFAITMKGANFLRDDSGMRKAASVLGKAFVDTLPLLVEATRALPSIA